MNKKYFQIASWIAACLSGEENARLDEWRKDPKNEKLFRRIERNSRLRLEQKRVEDFPCEVGWRALQDKRNQKWRKHILHMWMRVAAVVFLFIGAMLGYWMLSVSENTDPTREITQNIQARKTKAKLILGDGKEIDLEMQQGTVADSLPFIRNSGNCLTYQVRQTTAGIAPVYHEVVIPACGEYQLQLSDGTIVFLNAMTKLRFPDFFSGPVREVELEGEAFFKVVKDAEHPFVVKSLHSKAFVYGTQFNICAYPDDEETHTTLVEGKVTVEHADSCRELHPGEQWSFRPENGEISVEMVEVSLYTAWKDGKMRFKDARLEDIMRTVGRWYGVEISYQDEGLKELRFGCNCDRNASIEPLLRIFEANGKIKIESDGRRLKIKRGR